MERPLNPNGSSGQAIYINILEKSRGREVCTGSRNEPACLSVEVNNTRRRERYTELRRWVWLKRASDMECKRTGTTLKRASDKCHHSHQPQKVRTLNSTALAFVPVKVGERHKVGYARDTFLFFSTNSYKCTIPKHPSLLLNRYTYYI